MKCVICKKTNTAGSVELNRDSQAAPVVAGRICYVCLGEIGQCVEECKVGRIHDELKFDGFMIRGKNET